jgi:hypothetical protein
MECIICFNEMVGSDFVHVLPCRHSYCETCIIEALKRQTKCPVCRCVPTSVEKDCSDTKDLKIACEIRPNEHFGITLIDTDGAVKISRINRNDIAYLSGLRKYDILTSINNIPCIKHNEVINVLNELKKQSIQTNSVEVAKCAIVRKPLRKFNFW